MVTAIMQSGAVVTPFVAFQFYGYYQHCDPSVGSVEELRPWCTARLPYLYGFVQKHYWWVLVADCGFYPSNERSDIIFEKLIIRSSLSCFVDLNLKNGETLRTYGDPLLLTVDKVML